MSCGNAASFLADFQGIYGSACGPSGPTAVLSRSGHNDFVSAPHVPPGILEDLSGIRAVPVRPSGLHPFALHI
jgi:hypothetical protein